MSSFIVRSSELYHVGNENSGRYPRGSGERPYQHVKAPYSIRKEYRKKKISTDSLRISANREIEYYQDNNKKRAELATKEGIPSADQYVSDLDYYNRELESVRSHVKSMNRKELINTIYSLGQNSDTFVKICDAIDTAIVIKNIENDPRMSKHPKAIVEDVKTFAIKIHNWNYGSSDTRKSTDAEVERISNYMHKTYKSWKDSEPQFLDPIYDAYDIEDHYGDYSEYFMQDVFNRLYSIDPDWCFRD